MATPTPQLTLADLQVLADGGASDLSDAIVRLLGQPDPPTGPVPKGALDLNGLKNRLATAYALEPDKRRVEIALLWRQYLTQVTPPPAPRLFLADFLQSLYEKGDEPARTAVVELASKAALKLGLWGGLKRIYKLAEQRHDALIFGALAARLDREGSAHPSGDVSKGTLVYLRRRGWRYLKHLAQAMPELYPQFAASVLVQYPNDYNLSSSWIANHVLRHLERGYDGTSFFGALPQDLLKHRAFPEAWKAPVAADSLMVLVEECQNDDVARFAIQALRADFPQLLRTVDPAWLDRISRRKLGSIHEFVVDTLQASPEFHAAKLKGLGLHETVLALLVSPSQKARTFAIEYARAHGQDLSPERLVEYASSGFADTVAWAAGALQKLAPKTIGHLLLGRLLDTNLKAWAAGALETGFDRKELPRPWLIDLLFGSDSQRTWAFAYLGKKYAPGEIGAEFWKSFLADPRALTRSTYQLQFAFTELFKLPPESIGGEWALQTLSVLPWRSTLLAWLQKVEVLPGANVEQIKGLVFDPQLRAVALTLLGRPRIARFADIGLPWLLVLARRADPMLNQWATRYLLQNLSPGDFAEGNAQKGVERLLELATGAKEPEPVRAFAQSYLTCHHPTIGPAQPQSVSFQLKPQLTFEAYQPEPYWKALFDARPDVRKFAVAIVRASLRRWGWHTRVYELADSENKEVRSVAFDALLKAGQPGADPQCTLEPREIDASRVFAMTESRIRSTRELAMELIARHYDTLGGPERLGWLMASADRTVRQMAVRMLWERHRPRHLPPGWKPKGEALVALDDSHRFADVEALRQFLRTLLFGLPPGRAPEPSEGQAGIKKLSAGASKRRAVESARDLALDDEAFARVLSPLLFELTGSIARGEWETCLSALAALQRAHPALAALNQKGA